MAFFQFNHTYKCLLFQTTFIINIQQVFNSTFPQMVKPEKTIHQPLGGRKNLDKIIKTMPPQSTMEQTRGLSIIYARRKLQVEIPVHWTVNKVKCMMCSHFDILHFDKFEFQCNKMLIPGKTLVQNLPHHELIVTQADCPKALDKYYKQTMKEVVKRHKINTQSTIFPITHRGFSLAMAQNISKQRQSNLEQVPVQRNIRGNQDQGVIVINIFRVIGIAFLANIIFSFASYVQIGILAFIAILYYLIDEHVRLNDRMRRHAEQFAQRLQEEENRRRQEQRRIDQLNRQREINIQINPLQNVKQQTQAPLDSTNKVNEECVKVNAASLQQDQIPSEEPQAQATYNLNEEKENIIPHVKDNQFKKYNSSTGQQLQKEQPQPQPRMIEQPPVRAFKAKIKLWMAFLVEATYCYILSIFPNWTVETHLHANQIIMNNLMDQVKNLDPDASQQVKKWKIKQINSQPKLQEEQKPKLE